MSDVLSSIIDDLSAYDLNLEDYGLTLRELPESELEILKTNLDILSGFNPDIVKIGLELYQADPEEFDLLADVECVKNLTSNLELINDCDHDILEIVIEAHNSGKLNLNDEDCSELVDLIKTLDDLDGDDEVDCVIELHKVRHINLFSVSCNGLDSFRVVHADDAYDHLIKLLDKSDDDFLNALAESVGHHKLKEFAVNYLTRDWRLDYVQCDNGFLCYYDS